MDQASTTYSFTTQGVLAGMRRLSPIAVLAMPFGMAFGAAAIEAGMRADQALVASLIMFAGASQFAALDLWQSPLPFLSLGLVVLAVNARHIVMGAAISPYVNPLPPKHWFAALVILSDANFADSYKAAKAGERDAGALFGGGLILWMAWALSSAIGVFAGSFLGGLERFGIDVAMGCFFAALTFGMVPDLRRALPVLVACVVAVVSLPLLPTGWNIIVAALTAGFVGAFLPLAKETDAYEALVDSALYDEDTDRER